MAHIHIADQVGWFDLGQAISNLVLPRSDLREFFFFGFCTETSIKANASARLSSERHSQFFLDRAMV